MTDEAGLIGLALKSGADKAVIIDVKDIVFDTAFRGMCEENRCGVYGRCYMCPPDNGEPEELIARARSFDRALFYQTITALEDSYDFEGMQEARKELTKIGQRIRTAFADVPGIKALHLSAGGCGLCPKCAKIENAPCRYPDKAMSSLEGYCMDVYQTSRKTPLKYINGPDTVTYFGMVLFREDRDA